MRPGLGSGQGKPDVLHVAHMDALHPGGGGGARGGEAWGRGGGGGLCERQVGGGVVLAGGVGPHVGEFR